MADRDDENLPATQDVTDVATTEVAAPIEFTDSKDIGTALIQLVSRIDKDSGEAMVSALERMCDLQIKMDAVTAKKTFAAAKARLQAELNSIPAIGKMEQGGFVKYKYPTLDQIGVAVKPICESHDFSYSFENDIVEIGGKSYIKTTFVLLHKDGHKELTPFFCEPDDFKNNKLVQSSTQAAGYIQTASMRRAMIAGLGLTWCDPDTDGLPPEDEEKINENEQDTLMTLLKTVSDDPEKRNQIQARFYRWIESRWKAKTISDIPKSGLEEIIKFLAEKKSREQSRGDAK